MSVKLFCPKGHEVEEVEIKLGFIEMPEDVKSHSQAVIRIAANCPTCQTEYKMELMPSEWDWM